MNRPNHSQQSNPREELVDKLHGTLSTLRRERDELHRSKQLAIERLRLIKEEKVTAEDNIRLLNKKYENIISSNAQQERRAEIAKLQREVERLGREAKFQHMELVGKRERMNKLKTRIQEEEIEYSKHLRIAKEALHIRREKVAARQANHATVSNDEIPNVEKIRKLVTENGNGNSIDFFLKMQRLVQKKTAEVVDETNALRVETETAKMIISGYEIYMQKDDVMGGYTRNFTPALQQ